MKKGVLRKSILTMGLLTIMGATTAFAAYSPTFRARKDSKNYTHVRQSMSSKKTTPSKAWRAHVSSKTMWSTPSGWFVDSRGTSISDSVDLKVGTNSGRRNTGRSGNTYYKAIKPAWNQMGSDTKNLRINAD